MDELCGTMATIPIRVMVCDTVKRSITADSILQIKMIMVDLMERTMQCNTLQQINNHINTGKRNDDNYGVRV
jgi:hypothetical protein